MLAFFAAVSMLHQTASADNALERTVFQTGRPYSDRINSRADVAIVYGIDKDMPRRVESWRARGYRIHLMTGVAWGEYQDYLYGRFDGVNHEDEAQTRANGEKISHGGDVYYMSPGANYGKFLSVGVQRALDVGVEAVHLEEPEFWSWGGHAPAFKREWEAYYNEPWQAPEGSPDARWRSGKLMYDLYRRALQQVFDHVQEFNRRTGKRVRCYVPTHSLLNYADWGIVSPESSLARLNGCDGYIAQVWTGTAREPNVYKGVRKERTFETGFLEYGSMQNLVRSTGRSVWYLADPIEDNPNHDWGDYRRNYHSTLIASLLQPEVWQYEIMPWPERIFNDKYPSESDPKVRVGIPDAYATELQVVFNALKDMKQASYRWDSGTQGVGVVVSDSLMFQRGAPNGSDDDLCHVYGLAMPFVKRGMPVQPMQLENVVLPGYLDQTKVLLMTYQGQKPLTPDVHAALAQWVQSGGSLVFVDDDTDPYLKVREWWNSEKGLATPRRHLFELLGASEKPDQVQKCGQGRLLWLRRNPHDVAHDPAGSDWLFARTRQASPGVRWRVQSAIGLWRGPYLAVAGLDEAEAQPKSIEGLLVDLFDPGLRIRSRIELGPSSRHFLVDLKRAKDQVVACAGEVASVRSSRSGWSATVEGMADTRGILLVRVPRRPQEVLVAGRSTSDWEYESSARLVRVRFANQPSPQPIEIRW